MHELLAAMPSSAGKGQLEVTVALVGGVIAGALLVVSALLLLFRSGSPLIWFGGGLAAGFGTLMVLSFV